MNSIDQEPSTRELVVRSSYGTNYKSKPIANHDLVFTVSSQGLVTILRIDIYEAEEGKYFGLPHDFNIDWSLIDTLASRFAAQNIFRLKVYLATSSVVDLRAFVPYVRARMPHTGSTGRLGFYFSNEDMSAWIEWTQENEMTGEEDGRDGQGP